ncbi:MAG TPA: hypothetical protein VF137_12355 [Candidatus Dormibacteraeota bacterium]
MAAALEAWRAWLLTEQPGRDPGPDLEVVRLGLEGGLRTEQIAALVHAQTGRASWAEQAWLAQGRAELDSALARLRAAPPGRSRAEVEQLWGSLAQQIGSAQPASAVAAPASSAAVAQPRQPFSWSQFFSEHAIQLLGYSGAFLLGVAVLLYDLSGQSPGRFFALAALDLALFAAAYASSRLSLLRVLAQAYVAMAALLLPLTLLAAYVFLNLQAQVPVLAALALGGVICALTYGALAMSLRSTLYSWVSLLALTAAVFCGVQQPLRDGQAGDGVAALGLVLVAVGVRLPAALKPAAVWLGRLLPGVGALMVLPIQAAARPEAAPDSSVALSFALALATAAYAAWVRLERRPELYALPAYTATLLVLSLAWLLHPPALAWQWVLLVLALANVATGRLLPAVRMWEEAAAGVLFAFAVAAMGGSAGGQALFFVVALAAGIAVAVGWRSRLWSLYAALLLLAGWYWFGKALLPAPANPGPDDLARLYSPVPLVLLTAGALRRRYLVPDQRQVMYGGFAVVALWVAFTAAAAVDDTFAGAALVVYSIVGFALALWEEWRGLTAAALVGLLAGFGFLLAARTTEVASFLLLVAIAAAVSLGAARALEVLKGAEWAAWPRYLGLAEAGASAVVAAGVAWSLGRSSTLIELGLVMVIAAGALAWYSLRGPRESLYAAVFVAGALFIPISAGLGVSESQWRLDPIALILLGLGARALSDAGLRSPRASAVWLQAAGLALLLGLTTVQILNAWGGPSQASYTGVLALEGVLCIVLGVAMRSRWPAAAGGLALVVAAVSALFQLATQLPLSAIFGLLAGVLIAGATVLALLRGRVRQLEGGRAWSEWL